jgi:hypothetical protein
VPELLVPEVPELEPELVEPSEEGVVFVFVVPAVLDAPELALEDVEDTDVAPGAIANTSTPAAPTAATPPVRVAATTRRRARSRLSEVLRLNPGVAMPLDSTPWLL